MRWWPVCRCNEGIISSWLVFPHRLQCVVLLRSRITVQSAASRATLTRTKSMPAPLVVPSILAHPYASSVPLSTLPMIMPNASTIHSKACFFVYRTLICVFCSMYTSFPLMLMYLCHLSHLAVTTHVYNGHGVLCRFVTHFFHLADKCWVFSDVSDHLHYRYSAHIT